MNIDYLQYKPMIQNCFSSHKISSKWWKTEIEPRLEEVMEDNPKAVKLMALWAAIFFCLIKYNESNSNTVQVALINAFNLGKYITQLGIISGLGKTF